MKISIDWVAFPDVRTKQQWFDKYFMEYELHHFEGENVDS